MTLRFGGWFSHSYRFRSFFYNQRFPYLDVWAVPQVSIELTTDYSWLLTFSHTHNFIVKYFFQLYKIHQKGHCSRFSDFFINFLPAIQTNRNIVKKQTNKHLSRCELMAPSLFRQSVVFSVFTLSTPCWPNNKTKVFATSLFSSFLKQGALSRYIDKVSCFNVTPLWSRGCLA